MTRAFRDQARRSGEAAYYTCFRDSNNPPVKRRPIKTRDLIIGHWPVEFKP